MAFAYGLVRRLFLAGGRSLEVCVTDDPSDPRTTDQLRAEIAALKRQISARAAAAAMPVITRATKRTGVTKPRLPGRSQRPIDRRAALAMWLAPLLLAEPVMKATKRWAKRLGRRIDV